MKRHKVSYKFYDPMLLGFFHIHLGIGNVSTTVSTNQPWRFYTQRASISHSFSKYNNNNSNNNNSSILDCKLFLLKIEIDTGIQMLVGIESCV